MAELIKEFGKGAKQTADGFVNIKYRIKNLKEENSTTAKNADVRKPVFTESGFHIIIIGHEKGHLKDKVYMPFIVKLPYEIVPDACTHDVDDDSVVLILKKKDIDESWESEIRDDTLETAEPEQIQEFLDAKIQELVTQGVIRNQGQTT